MIDELVLERALRAEADTYPVPPDGPAGILGGAGYDAVDPEPRRPRFRLAAGIAAALVLLTVATPAARQALRRGGGELAATTAQYAADKDANRLLYGGTAQKADSGGAVRTEPKVVRTGTVLLEVREGRVAETLSALTRLAGTHRGFVAASGSDATPGSPSGTVTLRIPVADFERVLEEVRRLGDVRSSGTKGEDVTEQATDIEARLRALVATRNTYQALLARATNVGEVLSVQQKVAEVQTQVEQLQAQQRTLADSTTYATLHVEVTEPGARDTRPREGFAKAWDRAVDGFVGGFEWLVAASGTIAFLLVLGALLLGLGRLAYRSVVRRVV